MEAMALGMPIVSTNVGGLPYLISDKIDGVLVVKKNVEQMSEAVVNLIEGILNSEKLSKKRKRESRTVRLGCCKKAMA